jgi:hypothetical protein
MNRFTRALPGLALVALAFQLGGCATGRDWTVSGGNREAGLVRVSYEYPEFQEPAVSEAEAAKLALNRCEVWGFEDAKPIAGALRQCSNMDGGNCDLWRVTREFQCTRGAAEGLAGLVGPPSRLAPRIAR